MAGGDETNSGASACEVDVRRLAGGPVADRAGSRLREGLLGSRGLHVSAPTTVTAPTPPSAQRNSASSEFDDDGEARLLPVEPDRHVVDAVRASDHPRHQGGHRQPGVRALVARHAEVLTGQRRKPRGVGQRERRDQIRRRHQIRVIEHRRRRPTRVKSFTSEMPFRVVSFGTVASTNLPARQGISLFRRAHTPKAHRWIEAEDNRLPRLRPVCDDGLGRLDQRPPRPTLETGQFVSGHRSDSALRSDLVGAHSVEMADATVYPSPADGRGVELDAAAGMRNPSLPAQMMSAVAISACRWKANSTPRSCRHW